MTLELITAPTLAVVTLNDIKAHLRVSHSDEDAYISTLIDAAVAYLDGWQGVLGHCLGLQTWAYTEDTNVAVHLPLGPLVSVTSVSVDGVALSAGQYDVAGMVVAPVDAWDGEVRVVFTCGHATTATIHKAVPMLIKLLVGHWYANREGAGVPDSVKLLVSSLRRVKV